MSDFKPGLIIDSNRNKRRVMNIADSAYVVPAHIDRRPELLPTSDQGRTSQCAAYSMAGWIEYYRWKFYGFAEQIDPDPIYKLAKTIDGIPDQEGTTLEAVLKAAIELGFVNMVDSGSIREVLHPAHVKQALHRYGVVLSAFGITEMWSDAQPNGWIPDGGHLVGGHAVVLCGYDQAEAWYALQNSWGEDRGWRGFNRISAASFDKQFMYGLVWDFKR